MKRKITLSKVLIALILSSTGILIVFNILRLYVEKIKIDIPSDIHICSDINHITCDGNCECDGLGCYSDYSINTEDSLIADETYIITDLEYPQEDKIGYTLNKDVANILIDQGCKITFIDGDYIWFSYTEIPVIP